VPVSATNDDAGHAARANSAGAGVPSSSPQAETGQTAFANSAEVHPPVSALIDQLAELQVRRKFWIKLATRQGNAALALIRRAIGWRYDEDETARDKINKRAASIFATAQSGKAQKPEDAEIYQAVASDLAVIIASMEPGDAARHQIELEMARTVRKLPAYPWAKSVKGLGDVGLAVIIGEAGDLGSYPTKGHLWKRLGLAPFEGQAYSTWRMKGGLTSEQWTDAGYSPRRRAEIFSVIGDPLFRAQSVAQGPYRAVYDRRRSLTGETHPDWTKAHSHADALRVMTKIMLRDLWREWNRAMADQPVGEAV
jgi:hypothetical protein